MRVYVITSGLLSLALKSSLTVAALQAPATAVLQAPAAAVLQAPAAAVLQAPAAAVLQAPATAVLQAPAAAVLQAPAAAVLQAPAAPTDRSPWAPEARCKLNPARPQGLHPDAHSALRKNAIAHRITQGINHSSDRGNVHDTDVTIKGIGYTGAADISVRCLTGAQIQALLRTLAGSGFAAWYRKDGEDGWRGPPHIHAVWAGSRLKPILQRQVESWLAGKNGLGSDQPYKFWQASPQMRDAVRTLYRKFN